MTKPKPMQLRLPAALKDWIASQAEQNASSQNSEVIRAIRERMKNHDRILIDYQQQVLVIDGVDVAPEELKPELEKVGFTIEKIERQTQGENS
ncbi:Arc family DNA-binding protein [Shimia sediminis]|uniref:Arc family DNA-binding protein n=1 Tax=Shimia sediminis TaxID=2497945 RepID=UPI000F8F4481|nr:Arc family DNA-binding protein [Shimia sediminis]